MALPPDPRKHKNASKAVEKPEPDHIANASKMVGADHLAASGKVIEDRRGAPEGSFGNPPYSPTDSDRAVVEGLVVSGCNHEQIAAYLDISHDTLTKHYRKELDTAKVKLAGMMTKTMMQRAMDNNHKDCQRAYEYWMSRQFSWKETLSHEHGNILIEVINGLAEPNQNPK